MAPVNIRIEALRYGEEQFHAGGAYGGLNAAAGYVARGDLVEAKKWVAEALKVRPRMTAAPFRNIPGIPVDDHQDWWLDQLKQAGLPDGPEPAGQDTEPIFPATCRLLPGPKDG